MELARQIFTLDDSVVDEDFAWGATVSVGLDRLVEDFDLDCLAYYHRGLDGEQHERLGAGMILGASLLTARGIPATGEYELRTTVAQLVTQVVGRRRLVLRDPGAELRRRRGRDGPRRPGPPRRERRATRCCAASASTTASAAGASASSSTSSTARSRCSASARTATARSSFIAVRGHGRAGPAAGDRQHHEPGRLRPRPGRVGRRVERHRRRPPLVAVARAPRRATTRPPPACSASTSGRSDRRSYRVDGKRR